MTAGSQANRKIKILVNRRLREDLIQRIKNISDNNWNCQSR